MNHECAPWKSSRLWSNCQSGCKEDMESNTSCLGVKVIKADAYQCKCFMSTLVTSVRSWKMLLKKEDTLVHSHRMWYNVPLAPQFLQQRDVADMSNLWVKDGVIYKRRVNLCTNSWRLEARDALRLSFRAASHWESLKYCPRSFSHFSIGVSFLKEVLACSRF